MTRDEFASELRRMASENGLWLSKEAKLLDALRPHIDAGADFVNIVRGSDKNDLLVITTYGVTHCATKMTSVKVRWTVPIGEVRSASASRRVFGRYVIDEVEIRTDRGRHEFQVGFNEQSYGTEVQRDIAQGNAAVAAAEILNAQRTAAVIGAGAGDSLAPPPPVGATRALDDDDPNEDARKDRLFAQSVLRLRGHPLASPAAHGVPIGDGCGMEELVALVRPVFAGERSMARWCALRCALTVCWFTSWNPETASAPWEVVLDTMGLDTIETPTGAELRLAGAHAATIAPDVRENPVGLAWSITQKVVAYDSIRELSIEQANETVFLNEAMGYDYICWVGALMLRVPSLAETWFATPTPVALLQPGWYREPIFGRAHRYWDGNDWTDRVRDPSTGVLLSWPMS